jgi:hypothetical protein
VHCSLNDAREIGQAGTLMFALAATSLTHFLVGDYTTANMQSDEVILLADEKGTVTWKGWGMMNQGCVRRLRRFGAAADSTPGERGQLPVIDNDRQILRHLR